MAALINGLSRLAVPLVIGAGVIQASLYDVPGGHRAVIFDRFSGVRDLVSVTRPVGLSTEYNEQQTAGGPGGGGV